MNAVSSVCLTFLVVAFDPFFVPFGAADLSDGVLIADKWGDGVAGLEDEAGGPGVGLADDTRGPGTTGLAAGVGALPAAICTSCPGRKVPSAVFTDGS